MCLISKVTSPDVTVRIYHPIIYSLSGMVPSSSLISRPIVFRDPDFVINYWQNNENKTFPVAGIYVKCSCAPGCRNFFLCSYSTGCREAIHDEFLLAELSKCVTVSNVLKYLAADKCNE